MTTLRPAGIALAASLAVLASAGARAQSLDTHRYCVETAPNVVFYLDVTTPYDEIDKTTLIDGVAKVIESLAGGERIAIRTIADTFADSAELLDQCMPSCPSEGFLKDLFSDCTEGVVINLRKQLKSLLVATLSEQMGRSTELKYSEIVRTISLSASEEYRSGRPNRIFLFSDLIENSEYLPGARFFSTRNDQLLSSIAKDRLAPNLAGAEVQAFGVGRTGDPRNRHALPQEKFEKLVDFWEAYFSLAGGSLTVQQTLGRAK
jgi:hypothetical protein